MRNDDSAIESSGSAFLPELAPEDRRAVLFTFELALTRAMETARPEAYARAAAETIAVHSLAGEMGLDYGVAAEVFRAALRERNRALRLLLGERGMSILLSLRSMTADPESHGVGIPPECLLEEALTAYLHAVDPCDPRVAGYAARGAAAESSIPLPP